MAESFTKTYICFRGRYDAIADAARVPLSQREGGLVLTIIPKPETRMSKQARRRQSRTVRKRTSRRKTR
jgi:hypothetical protein